MRDPGLDFQPRPPRRLSLLMVLVAALLCGDAGLSWQAGQARVSAANGQLAEAGQRLARLQREGKQAAQQAATLSAPQAKALAEAEAAMRFDWEPLFQAIDRATTADIALLAVVPDMSARSLRISGEARRHAALLAFVEALPGGPLKQASLVSHRLKREDSQRPLVFDILVSWEKQ